MRKFAACFAIAWFCLAGCKPPASEKLKGPERTVCLPGTDCVTGLELPTLPAPPPPPRRGSPEERAYLASLPPLIPIPLDQINDTELRYFFLSDSGECGKSNCFHDFKFDRSRVIDDPALTQAFVSLLNDRSIYQDGAWGCKEFPGHGIRIRARDYEQDLWIDGHCVAVESWTKGRGHTSRTISDSSSEQLKQIIEKIRRNARRRR